MKAKNNAEVRQGYLLFAIAMCCAIATGFVCVWSFVATADREITRMDVRSQEYDAIFARQITLTEKVDSLYNSLSLLGAKQHINEMALYNRISNQKMGLTGALKNLEDADALLYGKLSEQASIVLQVKDSIRTAGMQVELVKKELRRCMENNRRATRRMILTNPSN